MDGGLRVEMDGNVSLSKPAVLFMRSSFPGPFWDLDVTYRPEQEAASAIKSFLYSKATGPAYTNQDNPSKQVSRPITGHRLTS
jgi:hypothetical protein